MLDIGIRYKYDALASHFAENFKLFAKVCSQDVIDAGPVKLKS
jgi:hypothetical protein